MGILGRSLVIRDRLEMISEITRSELSTIHVLEPICSGGHLSKGS